MRSTLREALYKIGHYGLTAEGRRKKNFFEITAEWVTRFTGSTLGFALALGIILIWLCAGPRCHYSDTWQLVINTGTTIVTFLMVFLIQRSQNKEMLALHIKLNELIRAKAAADNALIGVEHKSEDEVKKVYTKQAGDPVS